MIDQIRKFKYAQPFEPFQIELSSGEVITVRTPDHVAWSETGQGRVALLNDDDTFSIVSGLHVTRVGHLQEPKPPKRKRKTPPTKR
ncbi:MAG: hypothetical protein JO015_04615 [Verrucomicrobia bacterium]|nr:hypothetical protein [Verrucomicrobiota bacterium]